MTRFRAWYDGHKKITMIIAIVTTLVYLVLLAVSPAVAQDAALAYLICIGTVVVLVEIGSSNNGKKG